MKEIFKDDNLICYHDEANNIVFHKWLKNTKGPEFRDGLMKVQKTYIEIKKKTSDMLHWLADTREMGVPTPEDRDWLDNVWNNMLFVTAGVRSHAVIIGGSAFSKLSMDNFRDEMKKKYANKNLFLETFTSEVAAKSWFKEIEPQLAG